MTHAGIPTANPDTSSFDGDPNVEAGLQAAHAAGQVVEVKRFVDYFAEPEVKRFNLPGTDGQQWFDYIELREGGKAAYERATNKDIRVQRATGDARLSVDPATARQTLIRLSVKDACVFMADEGGKPQQFPFNKGNETFWGRVFDKFPAKVIEKLHQEIERENTWIAADDDVEALEEQKKQLDERIVRAKDEQAKKTSS